MAESVGIAPFVHGKIGDISADLHLARYGLMTELTAHCTLCPVFGRGETPPHRCHRRWSKSSAPTHRCPPPPAAPGSQFALFLSRYQLSWFLPTVFHSCRVFGYYCFEYYYKQKSAAHKCFPIKHVDDSRALWQGNVDSLNSTLPCSVIGAHTGPRHCCGCLFQKSESSIIRSKHSE